MRKIVFYLLFIMMIPYNAVQGQGLQAQIIRVDENGQWQWYINLGLDGDDVVYDIKPISNGFLMCGTRQDSLEGNKRAWLIKADLSGNILWEKTWGQDSAVFYNINLLEEGQLALCGALYEPGTDRWQPWLAICSEWGDTLYSQKLDLDYNGYGYGLTGGSDTLMLLSTLQQGGNIQPRQIALTSIAFPCPLWYPRAFQINNFWCPGGPSGCYPYDSIGGQGLSELLLNANAREQLLDYLHWNRINNVFIGNLELVLLEDDTISGLPYVQNRDSVIRGDSLRANLDSLLQQIRALPRVTDITWVMRDQIDEDSAQTIRNLAQLRAIAEFNRTRTGWFNEICVDHEFWRDKYGDPQNDNDSVLYPNLLAGWRNYQQLSDSVSAYKSDTLNRISRISTQMGRMDRDIDSTSVGYFGDGEDEDLMVQYLDSVFDRIYLFFFIPDQTDIDSSRIPTRFLTGWGNFDELAERLFHFGNNSSPSDIWPMFSAEQSVSANDENNYLGQWLQGTGTWSGPHYLPEVMSIFLGQLPDYYQFIVVDIDSAWIVSPSLTIKGYCFFRYGLKGLDSLRLQDAMPDKLFYCEEDNPLRIAVGAFEEQVTSDEILIASRLSSTTYRIFDSNGSDCGLLQAKEELNLLATGLYILIPINSRLNEKAIRILISH